MSKKIAKTQKKIKYANARVRHKKVLEHVSNGMSIEKSMLREGYSPSSARTARVTGTRTWQDILKTDFSDEKLAAIHAKLFNAHEVKTLTFAGKLPDRLIQETVEASGFQLVNIYPFMGKKFAQCIAPDHDIVDKALDKAFKIKKRYTDVVKLDVSKYQNATDAELATIINKGKAFFKKK